MNRKQIGIDKLVIYNIKIRDIDMKKLVCYKKQNVRLQKKVETKYNNNVNICDTYYLKIKDDYAFVNLTSQVYQYHNDSRLHTSYCIIELSVSNILTNNLNNLTVTEYRSYIHHDLIEYLKEKYGIVIDVDETKIKEIEVNTSFVLDKKFKEYSRVLYLLMSFLNGYYKKLNVYLKSSKKMYEHESFSKSNKSRIVKIYNKSMQLKDKKSFLSTDEQNFIDNNDIMRIVFSLLNARTIQLAFNTTLLSDLTDKKINDYYIHEFDNMFVRKYEKWRINNKKQLYNLIKKHKSKKPIKWQYSFLNECCTIEDNSFIAILLDINDLTDIIYEYFNKDRHASRIIKGLIKKCDKNNVFLHEDSKKIDEIFQKVHEAYK